MGREQARRQPRPSYVQTGGFGGKGAVSDILHWVVSGFEASGDRGSSDFDVRHDFVAAFGYEASKKSSGSFPSSLLHGWGLDGIVRARSGFPLTVLNTDYSMGLSFANVFRPDVVPGQAVWVTDPSAREHHHGSQE